MSGTNHFDVLLLAPELTPDGFDAVEAIFRSHDLQLVESRLLDGVGRAELRHESLDDATRAKIMDAAGEVGVDVFLLPKPRPKPRLFVFDMDSTLIQAEIIDELAGLAGVKDRVSAITERAMRGEMDFHEALQQRLALLKGIREEQMETLTKTVPLSEGLDRLMRGLEAAGVKATILSGGFGFFARHLQRNFRFDCVVCNELESEDGALTGRLASKIVDAQVKAESLRRICAEQDIALAETVVVGDGANDIPMIQLAGVGVAYRAKPKVKAAARFRLDFANLDALLHLL